MVNYRLISLALTERLLRAWLVAVTSPDILAAAGNPKYTTHGFDTKLSPMLFEKDILYFRRFVKFVAAFCRMASSSSRSGQAFSAASSLSRSDDVSCCCCLLHQAWNCESYRLSWRATNTFCQPQGFLVVDADLSCESPVSESLLT